ncbi:MAG: hypothetical protein NWQ45_02815, partial [Congregibacter sp.]|nr:hypothetical protein [Congregibacter sp.]
MRAQSADIFLHAKKATIVMRFAPRSELDTFLEQNPDIQLLEILMPDYNGIFRCKRVARPQFAALYEGAFRVPRTIPFLAIRGDMYAGLDPVEFGGDPDQVLRPVTGTLCRVPWLASPVAQVVVGYADGD